MKTLLTPRFLLLTGLVLIAAFARLIPHLPNFTPIAAIALFGGARFSNRFTAFAVPIAALFISDLIIGLYGGLPVVYICFGITAAIGILIRNRVTISSVIVASLTSSTLFFLITNLPFLHPTQLYQPGIAGIIESYTAGLIYFRNEAVAGLFYNALLFGSFYFAEKKIPALARI